MSTCSQCGAQLRPQAKFCNVCGSHVVLPPSPMPQSPAKTVLMSYEAQTNAGAQLVFDDGRNIPVQSPMTFGRDSEQCNFPFPDESMSRVHARLEERGGQWLLTDLNSSNGTFVNNNRIMSPTPLNAGDQIRVANTTFSFTVDGQAVPVNLPTQKIAQTAVYTPPYTPPETPNSWQSAPAEQVSIPAGGWTQWRRTPRAEGLIIYKSDRYTVEKGDMMQKGCLSIVLFVLFWPLAFLPFLSSNENSVIDFRLRDAHTGQNVDIKVIGDMLGNMEMGDTVAIWGMNQKGTVMAQRVHNYTSGSDFKIKK